MAIPDPISWDTANKVAAKIARKEPFSASYLAPNFESDMVALTAQAEELVAEETGLVANGPARVRVTDRIGWVNANVVSFRRLLLPLTEHLGPKMAQSRFAPISRRVSGTQLGVVLGWMSARVLGQYDLLLLEDQMPDDQDIVYYVGPNILSMEKRFAFPPREFRLWIALHECTHRAQFTGVPWLTGFFREQVATLLSAVEPDPKKLTEAVASVKDQVKHGKNPVADGGILALLASPEQQESVRRIYGLMALLEGHGDVTMSRAGAHLIPSADRFHRVMHERRKHGSPMAKLMQKALGMDAKMKQYAQGEAFIEAVEARGGPELMKRVWEGPEHLPSYDEITEPAKWIARHEPAAQPS